MRAEAAASVGLLGLGALLMAAYLQVTPYDTRGNDLGAHLRYIGLVEATHRLPRPGDCWECHQPPAYYALAALVLRALGEPTPPERSRHTAQPAGRALQLLAACFGLGTVACALRTVRLVLRGAYERIAAGALVTFWPTVTLDTCKIGNDALVTLLATVSLWQLVAWRRTARPRALVLAAAAAGLAAFAKSSGLVVGAVVVVSIATAALWPASGERRWPRGASAGLAVLGGVLAAWLLHVGLWMRGELVPTFDLMGRHLRMQNTLENLAFVHLSTFSVDPFEHAGHGPGRDEFWNYLFRTSLFGEFVSTRPETVGAAYFLAGVAGLLLVFVALGLLHVLARAARPDSSGGRELALTLLGFVAFLFVVRLRFPYAPHNDFRFILPVVLPCAVMCAASLGRAHRWLRRRARWASHAPSLLLVALCLGATRILLVWP